MTWLLIFDYLEILQTCKSNNRFVKIRIKLKNIE